MSALLTSVKEMTAGISSEVIPESTAAACSCATRDRLPVRKILMIGFAQPALAMDTFETMSDAEYSSQSAYLGRGKTRRGEHPHARQLGHQWGNQRTLGLRAAMSTCMPGRSSVGQSAYSWASSDPSLSRLTNRSMPPAIWTVIWDSAPPDSAMPLRAVHARWRTLTSGDPSSWMSCAVT